MIIKSLRLENYTVFKENSLTFHDGINVFIGENATGKTHVLKLLYSACKAGKKDTGFGEKIVKTMLPDHFQLARLVKKSVGNHKAIVRVIASESNEGQGKNLSIAFDKKTKRWDGEVKGKDTWEKSFSKDICNFIPAKEMLSHSFQLPAAVSMGNVSFDDTYLDIINAAKVDISMGKDSSSKSALLKQIEKMTGGKVRYDQEKDEFYLRQGNAFLEFNLVAEGIKKAGLLWLLAKNGTLERGSVLFWDEPEVNMNPAYISIIAEILLDLQENGVQIFIATHDYFLAKYLDIYSKKRNESSKVTYYSFYRLPDTDSTQVEVANEFNMLENNAIVKTYLQVYRDEVML